MADPAISINYDAAGWYAECSLMPELNLRRATLAALLGSLREHVYDIAENVTTTAELMRLDLTRSQRT